MELEQILGRNRLITPEEFREAQAHAHKTGESLVEALTRRGQLSVEDILQALALNYELPYLFRGELPIPAPIVGHAGDGNFHVGLLFDDKDPADVARAEAFVERLNARALAMDGTCTGEHGIGQGKMPFLEAELGDALDLMRQIKHSLDPDNIFNPGKIFA